MLRSVCLFIAATLAILSSATPAWGTVAIDTVPIGNPGNPPDPVYLARFGPLGSVDYDYRMGTYEVTNAQYLEFLNAKARSDPFALYDSSMGSDFSGGILREGSSPDFTYSLRPNMGNKPVNFVNYWDAARFANWMYNGQGDGDTETGSYTLGGVKIPPESARVRNVGATWAIPIENEWNKAAYYDPRSAAEGGPPGDDHYWTYPTMSDAAPTQATASIVGDISNPGPNVANYAGLANWNNSSGGNLTTVGTAGPLSKSYYGTFDQAANVAEWAYPSFHLQTLVLGGAFIDLSFAPFLTAEGRGAVAVTGLGSGDDNAALGFRLALVPEPSGLAFAEFIFVALAALDWWRRKARAQSSAILPPTEQR